MTCKTPHLYLLAKRLLRSWAWKHRPKRLRQEDLKFMSASPARFCLNKQKREPGVVVHTCNPSNSGG